MLKEVNSAEFKELADKGLVLADFFFNNLRPLQDAGIRIKGC